MEKEYVNKLENIIKQMLRPLRDIPFSLVIESISGYKVAPFVKSDNKNKKLLTDLIKVAELSIKEVNKKGILSSRPNEAGNGIEPFVIEALRNISYKADIPLTQNGRRQNAGYPDVEFIDGFGRVNYLECKTYNIANISTTQRSFYLSPSSDFKVTKDAYHFVISFEIYIERRKNNKNLYKCKGWKILSIEKLLVDVKNEFNCDNKRLYAKKHILAESPSDL